MAALSGVGEGEVLRAWAEHVGGNDDKALGYLKGIKSELKQIDASYKDAGEQDRSPKGGSHFVKGEIYKSQGIAKANAGADDEAKKLLGRALGQYHAVKTKYGGGDYGTQAIIEFNAVNEFLEEKGWKAKGKDGGSSGQAKVSAAQAGKMFRTADQLFKKGEYQAAIDGYVDVLNKIPETGASPAALVNLAKAYTEVGDKLASMAVVEYLAERFHKDDMAAKRTVSLGNWFKKQKQDEERFVHVYDTFVRHFPKHDLAPTILRLLGQYAP